MPKAKKKLAAVTGQIEGLQSEIASVLKLMEEKVRQLECLTQFSSLLNSTLDTSVVREKALQATCQLLECETATLFLVDPEKGDLYFETVLGDTGKELQKTIRLPINDRSIAGYVAMSNESLVINDVANDPRFNKRATSKTAFKTQNMICVPLTAKGKTIGVLQAINKTQNAKPSSHIWSDFEGDDLKLLQTLSHQVAIAVENSQLYQRLKQSFYDTVEALSEAIEKKDRYTGGHTKRVVHYSICIAKHMNLSTEDMEMLRLGAILHDVGKIGIEDKILKKAAPLDPYEWPVMKTHPELGYQIMKRVESLKDVIGMMRFHHERWDGKGYPLGLKGEEIPLLARIVAVADAYDAMVSTRPYRKGMDPLVAFEEIGRCGGSQFCPQVVKAFIEAFKHEKMGRGSGGGSSQLGEGVDPETESDPSATPAAAPAAASA